MTPYASYALSRPQGNKLARRLNPIREYWRYALRDDAFRGQESRRTRQGQS